MTPIKLNRREIMVGAGAAVLTARSAFAQGEPPKPKQIVVNASGGSMRGRRPPQRGQANTSSAKDRATHCMVPRQAVAQPIRQGEPPVADRHVWQPCVDEGRGALRHPPTPTARTDAAPLTRERHATLHRTLGTPAREGV